jgi:nucleoside-triphosphatase THEP1
MDPEVLKWGESILLNSTPTRVLIIDELGYLEFEKNSGWTCAFDILEEGTYEVAIITVRVSLLPQALKRWETARVIHLEEPSQITAQAADLEAQLLAAVIK